MRAETDRIPARTHGPKLTRRQLLIGTGTVAALTAEEIVRRTLFSPQETEKRNGTWQFASIDTMKQSRDGARDARITPAFISSEIRAIKELGATHVAIATPYDDEFVPILTEWVAQTRRQGLKIWFRGNFCAFDRQYGTANEGWFGYPHEPDETKHHERIRYFLTNYPDLFQKDDMFTPWPEPENVINFYENPQRYYDFLTTSYQTTAQAFGDIGKGDGIQINFSMNGDVARRLTPEVVQAIGNTVVIDHHVDDPRRMGEYIQAIVDLYGKTTNLIIGEFGASQEMSELQQAQFVEQLLQQIEQFPHNINGVNYWVLRGGPSGLLTEDGFPKKVTEIIKNHYVANVKTPR